uniref:ATP-dependent RNA helicase DHX33 n=1 Tax=Panagrolaimus sp. JU765 TaxID=591449 RepID=A0AC34Q076_9BILA
MKLEDMNGNLMSNSSFKSLNGSKSSLNGFKGNGDQSFRSVIDHLPVKLVEKQLIRCIRENQICIIVGETGSGKSTQIPQIVLDAGMVAQTSSGENENEKEDMIVVTQPRRLAAKALAHRVAFERKTQVGQEVGYRFRFENLTSKKTRIVYATDGILMNEAISDPFLKKYGMIIIDEAHERSLSTDMLMSLLQILLRKPSGRTAPMKVIVMSATMEADKFSKFFDNAKIFAVEGRSYETKLFYLPSPCLDADRSVSMCVDCVLQLHNTEPLDHGFLVFLPGVEEISSAVRMTQEAARGQNLKLLPLALYSTLPSAKQNLIYQTPSARKVIYSTNIAETSVTIPGIRIVIDSGKVKQKEYLAHRKIETLKVVNISKAQAMQRAGRAGREAPGKCYRLYSNAEYNKMKSSSTPEILRTNLCSFLLTFYKLGMKNFSKLHYVDNIPKDYLTAAVKELLKMNLIRKADGGGYECTEDGQTVSAFPIDPMFGKILLKASENGCLQEAITIVAFLSSDPVFTNESNSDEKFSDARSKFNKNEGDHAKLLSVYSFFKTCSKEKRNSDELYKFGLNYTRLTAVKNVRKQLVSLCQTAGLKDGSCGTDLTSLRRSLAEALPYNVCVRDTDVKGYRLLSDTTTVCKIHPSSCLARNWPQYIVFTSLIETNACYARDVTIIEKEWVDDKLL